MSLRRFLIWEWLAGFTGNETHAFAFGKDGTI